MNVTQSQIIPRMKLSASSDDDPMSEGSLNEIREKDGGDGDDMSGSEEFESERLSTP